jgi:hypothetical protein
MAEETKASIALETPSPTITASDMRTTGADANQFKQAFEARQQAAQNNINTTLDKSFDAQKQGLQNAYDQNMASQTQAANAGQAAYDTAKQNVYTQAAITGNDMNRWADRRGLNYQPGSQQALALGRARAGAAGSIVQQQQAALQESARQKALLSTDYNNRVQKAISNHDYKQAAALLDDFNNQNTWLDKNAAAMATFGNFTGYEQLYGPGQAQAMQQFWIGSNPELAYNTGVIDAARYKQITGREAPDYVPPPSEGGGGGGTINADFWINGRPGWTVAHGGLGHSGGGWQPR